MKEKHDVGVERMIIDIVRRNGIANLPVADIVATLDRLARSTEEPLRDLRSEEMTGPRDDAVAATIAKLRAIFGARVLRPVQVGPSELQPVTAGVQSIRSLDRAHCAQVESTLIAS